MLHTAFNTKISGGGCGVSSNDSWAVGGGGGYSCITRDSPLGREVVAVAAGGGGGEFSCGVEGVLNKLTPAQVDIGTGCPVVESTAFQGSSYAKTCSRRNRCVCKVELSAEARNGELGSYT